MKFFITHHHVYPNTLIVLSSKIIVNEYLFITNSTLSRNNYNSTTPATTATFPATILHLQSSTIITVRTYYVLSDKHNYSRSIN